MGSGQTRGGALVAVGRPFGAKPGLIARLLAPRLSRLLDTFDAGLGRGTLHGTLPDGTRRTLGGRAPGFTCEVSLHDWRGLWRVATGGSVGLYQGWAAGEWSSPDPVQLFALFMDNSASLGDAARAKGPRRWLARAMHRLRRNTRKGAELNIHAHYDLGNDFYAAWLGTSMVYSSARFDRGAKNLGDAQMDKIAAIIERLRPQGRDLGRVLEIGCGWGALAAQLHHHGRGGVTAISLSDEQLAYARERYPEVDFRKQDYRDVEGQFESIASVEMVEAVGEEYWPDFFAAIARLLHPRGGRAAIQFIAIRDDLFDAYAASVDFIQAYVFPGGMLVRESRFRELAAQHRLEWHDQVDFGQDYAETLKLWREQFDLAVAQSRLPPGFDQRFIDLWRFYLMYCEGGFRGGGITVSQVTLVNRTFG